MALSDVKFVGAGPWGPGLGRVMSVPEFDGSLYALRQAIQDLIDNPVEGVGIANFSVSGRQLIVHMTDTSTFGPFNLPMAVPRYRGVWAAAINYSTFDIVRVGGFGTYMVVQEHTSASTFDPYVSNSEGNYYIQIGPDPYFTPQAQNISGATLTLALSHQNKYLRSTNASGLAATLNAGVFPANAEIYLRQTTSGPVSIIAGSGVTINLPDGMTEAASSGVGQGFKLKRVAAETGEAWDFIPVSGGGGGGGTSEVVTFSGTNLTLSEVHVGKHLRFMNAAGCEVTVPESIFDEGVEFYIWQGTIGGPVSIVEGSTGVSFAYRPGKVADTAGFGSHITIKHVGGDLFDIWGDLADEP